MGFKTNHLEGGLYALILLIAQGLGIPAFLEFAGIEVWLTRGGVEGRRRQKQGLKQRKLSLCISFSTCGFVFLLGLHSQINPFCLHMM